MPNTEPPTEVIEESRSSLSSHLNLDANNIHKIRTSYGTGLAADLPLAPGSLIIKLNTPNLLLIERDSLQNVCSFCILEHTSLKRCSGCKIPYYCSTRCQNGHWKETHSRECKLLKKLPDVPPTAVRALVVMLLRKENNLDSEDERDWKALESHIGELKGTVKRWEDILLQARAGVEFTKVGAEMMEEAIRWLCVLSTNAFRITLPDNTPVGLCFSPTLARVNHSCNPNAFFVFDSRSISLRALRPIQQNEQIFISYIDPTETFSLRQLILKERYFFTCKCARCESKEDSYEYFLRCQKEEENGDERLMRIEILCPQQEELVKTAERCQATINQNPALLSIANSSKELSLLNQSRATDLEYQHDRISRLFQATKAFSSFTSHETFALSPYPETLHEIYLAYIDAQAFTPALITLLFILLHCDIFIYPQSHHPVRVVRLYTIAKLLQHISSFSPAELLQDISNTTTNSNSSASDLRVKDAMAQAVQGLDLINAFHVMIVLVWSEARKSRGEESAFVTEAEGEIRDVEEVQRLRGQTGKSLRMWMVDGGHADGRREAEKVGGELRALAGLMGRILDW